MVFSKNIAFIAVLAALAVVLVVTLVWTFGRVSGRSKINGEIRTAVDEAEKFKREFPTKEHLAAVEEEQKKAEAEYAKLKSLLLAWWDATVYDESKSPRQPGLFLGNLQQLRSEIRQYAADEQVLLGAQVENLSFPALANDSPPVEVTIDMLKQQSIMKDIVMLLIYNDVDSIDSIIWGGPPERGGKLYNKYRVTVSFTCKYPALAKFLKDLIDVEKASISGRGRFPHNYLVVEDLSYSATDRKVAALADSSKTGTERTTRVSSGGTYPELRNLVDSYPGAGGAVAPPERSRQPGGGTERTREGQPSVGREPNYNILTVTLTIAMVDFSEEITGKIEDLDKPQEGSEPAGTGTTSTASNAGR